MKMKLIYGNCLELMKKIPDSKINLIVLDSKALVKSVGLENLPKVWKQYKRICAERGCIIVVCKREYMVDFIASNRDWYKYEWIWNKRNVDQDGYELILVFYKSMPTYNPQMVEGKAYKHNRPVDVAEGTGIKRSSTTVCDGSRYPYSVFSLKSNEQRPLRLYEYIIKTYSNRGDFVLDTFMQTGITGIAASTLHRNFIGMEQNKKYFDLATASLK